VSPYPPVVLSCATTAPVQHLHCCLAHARLCTTFDTGFHLGTSVDMQVGRFSMLRKDTAVTQTRHCCATKLREWPSCDLLSSCPGQLTDTADPSYVVLLSRCACHITAVCSSRSCSVLCSAMNAVALSPVGERPCVYTRISIRKRAECISQDTGGRNTEDPRLFRTHKRIEWRLPSMTYFGRTK
jgi:hypothetical protein